jgi:hypothetical protein
MPKARKRVVVPGILEALTVGVDIVHEDEMKKPKMALAIALETMQPLKSRKKSAPLSCKLRAHLDPEALNPSVAC